MVRDSTIQELSEINAMAKILLEKSQQLIAKLGSENGSSPALRKKGGLSEEQIVLFKMKREKRLNK